MNEFIDSLREGFVPLLESEKLYNLLTMAKTSDTIKKLVEKNQDEIVFAASFSLNIFDFFTLTYMIRENINKEKAKEQLNKTIANKFSNITKVYLTKKYMSIRNRCDYVTYKDLFESICDDLRKEDTHKASCILFDIFSCLDFRGYISSTNRVMSNIITYYKQYDDKVVGNGIYNGSSIIAKLLDERCEKLILGYITNLIQNENVNYDDVTMIGGGGSNLVFKIGDKVLKLGETRNCRKICVNHRILASLYRKLETDENGKDLFYAEIMKYIESGVTEEERDELKSDLAKQGIIWDDDKLENCGYLPEGYDNYCPIVDNYEEVLANVDNPLYKEQFNKQRKRVVVLDSDNMRLDTTKLQKY